MSGPSCIRRLPPPWPEPADFRTSLLGWGVFMILLSGYCTVYKVVIDGTSPDFAGTCLYVIREWAVWWLLTPLALKVLRQGEAQGRLGARFYLAVGAAILLVSVSFRAAVNVITEARGTDAILVLYTPRYLAVALALLLIWHLYLRRRARQTAPAPAVPGGTRGLNGSPARAARAENPAGPRRSPNGADGTRYPATLMVSKGRDTCPVRVERIDCVTAAGNYVEIHSGDQAYLMRTTMHELEAVLPPGRFIRVHRSHIVNREAIDRIRTRRSGNGTVLLTSGRAVNVSKRYRGRLLNG